MTINHPEIRKMDVIGGVKMKLDSHMVDSLLVEELYPRPNILIFNKINSSLLFQLTMKNSN